ncbi:MAG: aspartate--tRNA(Asn) ligase, partial [Micromonosporaceae bacterium]|nr:aspartate--tRNA(Asn) ligase [Micromonosporaceae bacterium]
AATHRIAAAAVAGFRSTLDGLGFVEIHTPKIVPAATESGANLFRLDYFGRPAYLAQSPQLYKQMMVGVFERVYEVGPVFRAEPSDTARHLASYTSLDAELGFIDDHRDVIAACHAAVAGMLQAVAAGAAPSLRLLGVRMPVLPAEPVVVHFADVLAMISEATGVDVTGEPDLAPAHERWIGEWARREHGSDFVFVEGYPTAHRAFYTHPDPHRPGYSRAIDLIFRGLELVSGGQRLHRHGDYVRVLTGRGETDLSAYSGYLDAMRYGMPPHGGFAFGLERFVARLLEVSNVRQVTLFPRDLYRLVP